ncbi:lipase member H-like [Leguminivora glycinivorella]|uniref:lipase member H-like n=1 Tax=Leguminivora glycinivorella TaxID=1035111 RepID=UPI00200D60D4|nr:lipase member H-like [Leguminivora glycinivorella]
MDFWKWFIATCFVVFSLDSVNSTEYIGEKGGAPNPHAFVKYCGMYTEPTKVTRKTLRKLYLSVMGKDGVVTPYNYFNVTDMLDHPDIDFKNKKTNVYVGSYMDFTTHPYGETMSKQYVLLGYNALILNYMDVHWRNFPYPVAAKLMHPVSRYAAEMLANLTAVGLDPKQLELVGWGFGGQTMGLVAKNYREITGKNISMLVALDPSGPCFRTNAPTDRLDPSDADFVLSVVTNMDGHGIATPLGQATFYVNGGEYQPADIWFAPCDVVCSHIKAYFFWLSALLNPKTFIGMKCDTIQQARQHDCYDRKPMVTNTMDLKVNKKKTGIFYVTTGNRYPYGMGKRGLRKEDNLVMRQLSMLNEKEVLTI